jgi:asparagine synthase (glutamine-hydrolysing)
VSLIAGFVGLGTPRNPGQACSSMLNALSPWGGERPEIGILGAAAFGRRLVRLLPEDGYDQQPLIAPRSDAMLVADARVDNRDDLAAALSLDPRSLSDAKLVAHAWDRWGLDLFDHVLGDIAMAAWDRGHGDLILARSPMSQRPLFYHVGDRFSAFASMPAGLHAVHAKNLNFEHAACVAGLYSYLGSSTMFSGVRAVRHGHAVRLGRGTEDKIRLWRPGRSAPPRYRRPEEYGEHLLEETERAVRARFRRHDGRIASQLSAGRDSSAVTATAARALHESGETLLALTAAPRDGYGGPVLDGRLADESPLAAKTAAFHPNIEHLVCRTRALPVAERLTTLHSLHYSPLLNPGNLFWWEEMNRVAAARGVSVILNGASGNLAFSAGGANQLPDFLAENGFGSWVAVTVGLAGLSSARWRNALNLSFGAAIPPHVYRRLLRLTGRSASLELAVPVLRPPYRDIAETRLREQFGDPRPPRSSFEFRADLLGKRDNPEIMNLAAWGIDYRDPTSDRRLIDFCFSLPSRALVSARSSRPAFETAFGALLPIEVLHNRQRGQQSADWFEHFGKGEIRDAIRQHGANPAVADLLDLGCLDRLVQAWPTDKPDRRSSAPVYSSTVLGALALANFIDLHFPP